MMGGDVGEPVQQFDQSEQECGSSSRKGCMRWSGQKEYKVVRSGKDEVDDQYERDMSQPA